MKVVVAGGTGYIGSLLVPGLADAGHDAVVLTRRRPSDVGGLPGGAEAVQWDPSTPDRPLVQALTGADAVVNLAGTNIGTAPWTPGRRRSVLESRLQATKTLVDALADVEPSRRPGALVNASGIDYYGDRGEEAMAEPADPGSSFLATV